MSTYRQNLLSMLPDDVPHPQPNHLAMLDEVDAAMDGSVEQLRAEVNRIRNEVWGKLAAIHRRTLHPDERPGNFKFADILISSVFSRGYLEPSDPTVPVALSQELVTEHARRLGLFSKIFTYDTSLSDRGFLLENGGMKSKARLAQKLAEKTSHLRPFPVIVDISRMRIVTPDIESFSLLSNLTYSLHNLDGRLRLVRLIDWLFDGSFTKYHTPLRCMNAVFQGRDPHGAGPMLTEVQFVTRRMRAMMDLNHPFDVTKRLAYPSDEHKAWMHAAMMKAAILDFRDFVDRFDKQT